MMTPEQITGWVNGLRAEEREIEAKLSVIRTSLSSAQKLCTHSYVPSGHDSHYNYEACKYCGHEVRG